MNQSKVLLKRIRNVRSKHSLNRHLGRCKEKQLGKISCHPELVSGSHDKDTKRFLGMCRIKAF